MSYCSKCGAELPEGALFCQTCGAPTQAGPPPERSAPAPEIPEKKKKKSVFHRWWFWVLAVLVLSSSLRAASDTLTRSLAQKAVTSSAVTARPTATARPAATATPAPERSAASLSPTDIRPEVKEFLDSYEAFMDEYVAFMKKYSAAGPENMASLLGEYYTILNRYADFSEKIDAMDESELTNAELSYYIEVTGRVSQKLLTVVG